MGRCISVGINFSGRVFEKLLGYCFDHEAFQPMGIAAKGKEHLSGQEEWAIAGAGIEIVVPHPERRTKGSKRTCSVCPVSPRGEYLSRTARLLESFQLPHSPVCESETLHEARGFSQLGGMPLSIHEMMWTYEAVKDHSCVGVDVVGSWKCSLTQGQQVMVFRQIPNIDESGGNEALRRSQIAYAPRLLQVSISSSPFDEGTQLLLLSSSTIWLQEHSGRNVDFDANTLNLVSFISRFLVIPDTEVILADVHLDGNTFMADRDRLQAAFDEIGLRVEQW